MILFLQAANYPTGVGSDMCIVLSLTILSLMLPDTRHRADPEKIIYFTKVLCMCVCCACIHSGVHMTVCDVVSCMYVCTLSDMLGLGSLQSGLNVLNIIMIVLFCVCTYVHVCLSRDIV